MLSVLRIKNLAIVEENEIEFTLGLNVLTGETGAGKSIILKAIELLQGKRASTDIIRSGAQKCEVEGLFIIDSRLRTLLEEESDEITEFLEDDELLIRRVIDSAGKSKIYLNGSLVTAAVLQSISLPLLDITGQHQQQMLLDSAKHLTLLDGFGTPSVLIDEVSNLYHDYSNATRALANFKDQNQSRESYFARIQADYEELKAANLKENELELIEHDLLRLNSTEALGQAMQTCLELLENSDQSIESQLHQVSSTLEKAARLDHSLTEVKALFQSGLIQITEAKLSISEFASSLEADPQHLERLRSITAEITILERKYAKKLPELIHYLTGIEREISDFQSGALDEEKLSARVNETRNALDIIEKKISAVRKLSGLKLAKLVETELARVNMEHAKFKVSLEPCASNSRGADQAELLLAANPGEPFHPLAKVASGGELSRILLILKTITNEVNGPSTQIFDEVDAGIGGAIAQVVGEKLRHVSERVQVILVTHSPQIAALGDCHFVISKTSDSGKTRTSVHKLSNEERVHEIARMLAGKKVSANFESSAKELLSHTIGKHTLQKDRLTTSNKKKNSRKDISETCV